MRYSFMHKIVVPNTILIVDDDEMNRDVLGNIFLRLIPLKWLKMEKSVSIKY